MKTTRYGWIEGLVGSTEKGEGIMRANVRFGPD